MNASDDIPPQREGWMTFSPQTLSSKTSEVEREANGCRDLSRGEKRRTKVTSPSSTLRSTAIRAGRSKSRSHGSRDPKSIHYLETARIEPASQLCLQACLSQSDHVPFFLFLLSSKMLVTCPKAIIRLHWRLPNNVPV